MLDAAARFIDERYSNFSTTRFHLSAFSKVSSCIRRTVERVLYRDVQLDFTGWKGRKHPKWPAGSLRLLLFTLEERPELARYVHGASLDYQLSSDSCLLDLALEQFLAQVPNLKTLFLAQCPLALWDLPFRNISTFATAFAPGILGSILEQFPKLQQVYLRDCHVMSFSLDLPKHNLQTIRFDSSHDHAVAHFSRALSLCSDTVCHLEIRFIGGFLHPSPFFTPRMASLECSLGTNLRSLRLHNISVFSHLDSGYAQLLQNLPLLQDLHVSHHACFDSSAFSILPVSLRTLMVSDYHGYWEVRDGDADKNTFLLAMAKCISMSRRNMTNVIASDGGGACNIYDLSPLITVCEMERIAFLDVGEGEPFIRIFCEFLTK